MFSVWSLPEDWIGCLGKLLSQHRFFSMILALLKAVALFTSIKRPTALSGLLLLSLVYFLKQNSNIGKIVEREGFDSLSTRIQLTRARTH